jgi:hypothetical protein
MSDVTVEPPAMAQWQAANVTANGAALVHALCGAQYGDLEFDVGKSIRWTQWFTDDLFITDINLGSPRYWIVNWAGTYPKAFHAVTGINYFAAPVAFRKEQWRQARAEQGLQFDPEDWVLFVDAHEGLALDTRDPQPDDADVEPFKAFMYREVQRAEAAGKDRVVLPFYAFLRHDDIITAHYDAPAFEDGSLGFTTATCAMGTPYYVPYQGLTRLMKVKVLDDPDFDWTTIDQPSPWEVKAGTNTPPYPAYLNPTAGRASTPDVALPTDFRVTARVRPIGTVGANSHIAAQRAETTTDLAYAFTFTDTGLLNLRISTAGTAISSYTRPRDVADNVDTWVRASRRASGSISFEQSPDGVTWHSLGAPVAGGTPVFNSTAAISIGTRSATGQSDVFPGRIYWAQMEALDASGVPTGLLWRFDAAEYPGTGTSFTDPRGRTWTLASASAIGAPTPAVPPLPAVNMSIVSYGYAHWNLQDIVPPATTVEPLSEANDDGWRMRNLLSMVRPIPTLPYGDWQPPETDPPGTPGPWAAADINTPDPIEPQPVTPDPSLAHLLVPLYDNVLRLNMRDGVWYEGGELGNIPLEWDDATETWRPRNVSAQEWHNTEDWVAPVE